MKKLHVRNKTMIEESKDLIMKTQLNKNVLKKFNQ